VLGARPLGALGLPFASFCKKRKDLARGAAPHPHPHRQRHPSPTCTNRYKPFVSGDEGAFLSSPFAHFVQLPKQDAPRERAPGRRMRSGTSTSRTRTRQADEIRDPDVEHAHQAGGREQGPRRRGRPRGPSHTVHTHQFPRRRVGVRKVRVLQGARSRHCSDGRPSITRPHFDAMLSPQALPT